MDHVAVSRTSVLVTGLGVLSPWGTSLDDLWTPLMQGRSAIRLLPVDGVPPTPAAAVPGFDPSPWLTKLQRVGTERVSQMALAAARLGLADAGLDGPFADPVRVGVFVGTGMGGASTMDAGFGALYQDKRIPPLTVPTGMVNAAAAIVAMHTGAQGPVLTSSVACASAAVAVMQASHALERGEIDIALAIGAEALLVRGTLVAWHALGTLAKPAGDEAAGSCRPFSPDRDGLVLGEGASCLVLERADHAQRRGARVHARLAGSATRCDARHLTKPFPEGQVAATRAALRDAGLTPADIGYCNAHGTATQAGDPVEAAALREVWGTQSSRLMLSSTKAAHGHLLGAAGTLEAAITVLALARGEVPPTAVTRTLDPACEGPDHVLGEGRAVPGLRAAISNSFGGTNVCLVFARHEA